MLNKLGNFIRNFRIDTNFTKFIVSFSLINLLFYSYPLIKYYYNHYHSLLLLFPVLIFVFLITFLFYSLIIFKKSYKIILSIILMINSVIFYHMLVYGIVFDVNILINVTETNLNEASEFFSISAILFFVVFGCLPAYFLYKKVEINFNNYYKQKISFILISIFTILLLILPCYLNKKSKKFIKDNQRITSQIIPIDYFGAVIEYSIFKIDTYFTTKKLTKISDDATLNHISKNGKKNLLVFMIGESARAKNFSLNGYERNTNKFLQDYQNDIISFQNFESCATFTAGALTCTFSHLPRTKFDYAKSFKYESLIDIFNKLNFDIYWKSNNGKCKNVCNRVKHSLVKSFGTEIYDDLLLKVFKSDIKKLNGENNLIFLHGRGSHGPLYYNRYPEEFEIYKPACNDEIQNCSVEKIVNAYDNTIYYTSYIIKEALKELEKYKNEYNIAFVFMSDHGQSLGENGIFMHSAPYDTAPIDQKNPAFFMWFSQDFADEFNLDLDCLKQHKDDYFSQDNIFHSMLGLFDISSKFYQKDLDIFNLCKKNILPQK